MSVCATAPVTDDFGLVLSTDTVAAAAYREGARALLDRRPEALLSFARAARHDPTFALASAGIAVAASVAGDGVPWRILGRAGTTARFATRRERQHVGVIAAALPGAPRLTLALGTEHLHEFPEDAVVLSIVGRTIVATADAELVGDLRGLIGDVLAAVPEQQS
jgi:hypothetical protein